MTQRRSGYRHNPDNQQPEQRTGLRIGARRDNVTGALLPTPQANPENNQPMSQGHDWSAFDSAFNKPQGQPAINAPSGLSSPTQQEPMPGKAAGDWAALPVGGSRVIPDDNKIHPEATPNLQAGGPQAVKASTGEAAIAIDPKYQTPGADTVGRLTPAAGTGRGGLTPEQGKALIAAYPNLGIKGHADNLAFQKAYVGAMDPSKPMGDQDVMNVAHGLFAPKQSTAQRGSQDQFGTPIGSPGYQSPVNTADFSVPQVNMAQAPVNFAGENVGAAPMHPITVPSSTAGRAGSQVGSAVSTVGGFLKDFGKGIANTVPNVLNKTAIPAYNFAAGAVGADEAKPFGTLKYGAPKQPQLGSQTPQQVADWTPQAADVTTPITFPKFQPSGGRPSTPASSIAGFGQGDTEDPEKKKLANSSQYSFPNSL